MNNCVLNNGRIKKGNSKSRGYCGWHNTWDGKSVYLRSLREYFIACWLDGTKKYYKTECKTYEINRVKYKPDFFIFEDNAYNKIVKIIEAKYDGQYEIYDYYIDNFQNHFETNDIEYEVIIKYTKNILQHCSQEMKEAWIEKCKNNSNSSSVLGELNPMYGKKQSEETKRKIGEKAKARFEEPEYRENIRMRNIEFYNSPEGLLRRKQISEQRKKEAKQRRLEYESLPDIITYCKNCGKELVSKEGIEFCLANGSNNPCQKQYTLKNMDRGKKDKFGMQQKKYSTYIDKVATHFNIPVNTLIDNLDEYIYNAKREGIIPKNLGFSRKTLIKYNLIEE